MDNDAREFVVVPKEFQLLLNGCYSGAMFVSKLICKFSDADNVCW